MGPRRGKPVLSNGPNKYTSLNICTSVGHRELEITAYIEAIANSRPDVIIAPVDVEFGRQAPGVKRKDKMVERSTAWVRSFETSLKQMVSEDLATPAAWVPILPVEAEVQATYLQHLTEMASSIIGGIVVYDYASILCIPNALCDLPVISLTDPQTPHHVLRLVSLGVDLVTAPFITTASEAGIALTFEYPPKTASSNKPLGIDMSSKEYATDLGPLSEDCSCYACKQHHRAYIHHLLSVKEMLAWVLLQIHNHHIMDNFFRNIRKAIENGTFESATSKFSAAYQSILPVSQGQGPR